jgi:hypothetical protein
MGAGASTSTRRVHRACMPRRIAGRSRKRECGNAELMPLSTTARNVSGSFLHNATVAMFERHGFERSRQIGKHHWVVSRRV